MKVGYPTSSHLMPLVIPRHNLLIGNTLRQNAVILIPLHPPHPARRRPPPPPFAPSRGHAAVPSAPARAPGSFSFRLPPATLAPPLQWHPLISAIPAVVTCAGLSIAGRYPPGSH